MKHASRTAAPPSPPRRSRLAVGAGLLALATALVVGGGATFAAVQGKGDTLTVTRKTTKLRNAKRSFAPAVTDLVEGDKLVVDTAEGAWFGVTYAAKDGPVQGFVHTGDVSGKKDVRLSGEGVRENYSSSEAAAARKGFNPEVEKKYRESNPDLEPAFQLVDKLQARVVTDAEVFTFLLHGGLAQGGTQ